MPPAAPAAYQEHIMKIRTACLTAAALAAASAVHAASGVVVSKNAPLKGKSAAEIFAKFGAFCAIKE